MNDGQTITLRSDRMPFSVQLRRRNGKGSRAVVNCLIAGEGEALRLERVRRAFDAKCPKLAAWSGNDRVSVLVLEANDIQHSNYSLVWHAVKRVIGERTDIPDVIAFVETDVAPMTGWIFKDGPYTGDDVPTPNGVRCYTAGQLRATPSTL